MSDHSVVKIATLGPSPVRLLMTSAGFSRYKDPQQAHAFLTQWNQHVQQQAGLAYQARSLPTDWGQTVVWTHTPKRRIYQTLVFLPDYHSPALSWDIHQSLTRLKTRYRLCLVEINGQPGLSDGHSPALETDAYGQWVAQVVGQLGARQVTLIGLGMGALISLRACQQVPAQIKQAILINPAGLHALSPSFSLLRYYWLALSHPSPEAVRAFLQQAIFNGVAPGLDPAVESLLVGFHRHALAEFRFPSWWNQALSREELASIRPRVDLLLGAADQLFAYGATLERACQHLPSLGSVTVLPRLGHGMHVSEAAMGRLEALLAIPSGATVGRGC